MSLALIALASAAPATADLLSPVPTTTPTVPGVLVGSTDLTVPEATVPQVTVPTVPTTLAVVPTTLPVFGTDVPPVTVPAVTIPSVTVPPLTVPGVTLPPLTVPSVTIPPSIGDPLNGERPGVTTATPASPVPTSAGVQPAAAVPSTPVSGDPGAAGSAGPAPAGSPAAVKPPRVRVDRSVVGAARAFVFPFFLAALVMVFLILEGRLGGRDRKLTAAPVLADEDQLRFT